jgi:hypothetical protein
LYICFFNINLAGKPHFSVAFITGFVCWSFGGNFCNS